MAPITVMLKPASGLCNMRCRYCFYADETAKRETASFGLMSRKTLEGIIKNVLAYATGACNIAFQGGEPTLAGLDFFKDAVRLVDRYNVHRCRVSYALQTNGLLIDEDWCAFLAENGFLVGVSLDGPLELHDQNRPDAAGKGTYNRVMHTIQLLQSRHVEVNILTVVSAANARSFQKVYRFYDRCGFAYQQYIPCLDPLEEARGQHPWSLTPGWYEQYLKTAFDCWYRDAIAGKKKYHRYFDNLLLMLDGQPPEACGMRGVCGRQYVVEADGSVYPCDFYMLDACRLGNLATDTVKDIDKRRQALGFIQASAVPDKACLTCRWVSLCRGGCRRDRDYFEQGLGKNYYCTAYKAFFEHAYPRLVQVYRKKRDEQLWGG